MIRKLTCENHLEASRPFDKYPSIGIAYDMHIRSIPRLQKPPNGIYRLDSITSPETKIWLDGGSRPDRFLQQTSIGFLSLDIMRHPIARPSYVLTIQTNRRILSSHSLPPILPEGMLCPR